ncbi:MAG: TdeIII family type II restriction endonuclease [Candidatus Marinimicrobia bacterium]|nr:TdeIII family type II restriction endonuclease [Candidatus Neomarinimicrobiota bacterium]
MEKYNEDEFIMFICQKVKGIGEKTAIRISGYMEDLKNFYYNTGRLSNFKTDSGRQVVKNEQIEKIKKVINKYISDITKDIKKLWIEALVLDFVERNLEELRNTTLDSLLINPFLVKAFGFDDHREVVTFYFYQKITRSIVTSWGFTVEGLLLSSGAKLTEMPGFDIKIHRNQKNYQIQIKSSPNTMSIEQVRQLNTHIKNIRNKIKNIPILGMTYGTKRQINNQIQSTLINYPNSVLIGRELWNFIADENGYCQKVLNWIDITMQSNPTQFSDELEEKKESLIQDWEQNWGKGRESIEIVLDNFI